MIRFYDAEGLVQNEELTNDFCLEKVVWGENIFEQANEIFARGEVGPIPVFNKYGKVDCFCYNCEDYRYDQVFSFLKLLDSIEDTVNFLEYMDSSAEVLCIHELNELSYELYRMAVKHKINVMVEGTRWEQLGIKTMKNLSGQRVFHLNAENHTEVVSECLGCGEKKTVGENFRSFIQAGIKLGRVSLQKTLREINKSIPICLCKIPVSNPYVTKWSKAFMEVRDVHNKIQGYANYINESEKKAVEDIYGISRWRAEPELEECLVFSLNKHFNGFAYSKNRRKHRLYIIGPCIIRGYCLPSDKTLSYILQKKIDKNEYEVIRIVLSKIDWLLLDKIKELPIRRGDIIMFVADTESFAGIKVPNHVKELDLSICYERMRRDKPYFADCPIHVNADGHALLSEYIYDKFLEDKIDELKRDTHEYIQKGELLNIESRKSIREYVCKYSEGCSGNSQNGAIVMNCNPFTFGHRYLIEYAARAVDKLYVFVVEENKSEFTFEERFRLVKEGVSDVTNVIVIPSGNFVLSYSTLPSYFEKEKVNDIKINASNDIEIFARYIAPGFGIFKRFVGEEPIDNITRQYNEQMKNILPEFGIELCEIPRLNYEGEVISASKVRAAIKSRDWETIKKIVPETTHRYLKDKFK